MLCAGGWPAMKFSREICPGLKEQSWCDSTGQMKIWHKGCSSVIRRLWKRSSHGIHEKYITLFAWFWMRFANGLLRMEVAMEEFLDGEVMILKIVLRCLRTLNLAWKLYWNRVKGAKSCAWPWRRCLSLIAI